MEAKKVYPAKLMEIPPEGVELSAATRRLYEFWPNMDDRLNPLFTNFKYSRVEGIGKEKGVSRRDPSKVIKVKGTYYVYYTCRRTIVDPVGIEILNKSDDIPTYDWDLSDIYYATSEDGFHWIEQGIAVSRAPKGEYGDRSLSTPDILIWEDKYYLYYQTFTGNFEKNKGDYCGVSMAWSDSPKGPWHKTTEPIIPQGDVKDWDGRAIHDPYPLIYKDKIWLFYKGENMRIDGDDNNMVRAQGVAIADSPEGPYVKHEMNPILNSGHETFLFPYNEGIAAVLAIDGVEKNTIQYALDGIDFKLMSHIHIPPIAAGVYSPDAFTNSGDADGVTWGLCHMEVGVPDANVQTYIARFDCDLDRRVRRTLYRNPNDLVGRYADETFLNHRLLLTKEQKEKILLREKEPQQSVGE